MKKQNKPIISNLLVGSDPEVFLWNNVNNEFHSAVGFIKGTKKRPLQMDNLPKGFMWQVDCVALEYNIPPATNEDEWISYHKQSLKYMREHLPEELDLVIQASARFNANHLNTKQANTFGCDPDYNVWKGEQNTPPDAIDNLRVCGGHVAIGYDNPTEEVSEQIVRLFDLFLTMPSILLDPDTERRQLYGKAGSFRFKNFGVECRALSNYWLTSEVYTAWVYNQVLKIQDFINEGRELNKDLYELLPMVIDTNNRDMARNLCKEYGIELPEVVTESTSKKVEKEEKV